MKKTYVTNMPNHIGAFLQASRCFARLGVNITRVSYNKAVDSHTLFIDAEGTPEQLAMADSELAAIGYLQKPQTDSRILLIEFTMRDEPGGAIQVLELIEQFHFNISYISSQGDGSDSDHQMIKLGLFVDDPEKIAQFMSQAEKLCSVRVIDYNQAEKVYDNSIFYRSFVAGLTRTMNFSEEIKDQLLVNANLAMQNLDERGLSPHKTFDGISRFAELLSSFRGEAFSPRISRHAVTDKTEILVIEPPCGSNTTIIRSEGKTLFVDCGYSLYREEMEAIFRDLLPDYDEMERTIFLTHPDFDHCGLLSLFDHVITTERTAECLRREYEGEDGYRETTPLYAPYIHICKILTQHTPDDPSKIDARWSRSDAGDTPLVQVGFFDFGELHFEVYEGRGGHVAGETVLIDYAHRIVFTGDIYVNLKGMIATQAEYNRYAPLLMTSVDTEPSLCTAERNAIFSRLGGGKWQIYSGHGCMKEYTVNVEI